MQNNSKKRWIVRIRKIILYAWPFILSLFVFLSIKFSIRNPPLIEHYYSKGIYPAIAKFLSFFSNIVPFSLWDVFWVLIILLIISGLILVLFKKIKPGWYILKTLQLLALFYSFFYIVWGYNYFRPKIEKRIGWQMPKTDSMIFRPILDSIIKQTNSNYISIALSDYSKIDTLVEESYRKNSAELGINYPNGRRRPKTMLFSSFYGELGLNGYFGPFFNEIHVNYYLLPLDYPFVLAHEKAHQFGITSEAEANFVAFVICIKSEDQRLKYSGYLSLLLYFLKDASHMKDYKEYFNKIDMRVISDFRFRQKYYQGLENKSLSKMQSAAYNSYLKVNNIEKGVKNYNQVVSLVISWYYNSNLNRIGYQVNQIIPGVLIRVDFHIGFKVEPKINLYFKEVLEDMTASGEIKLESTFDSLKKHSMPADFKYILIDRIMPNDYKLSGLENVTLALHRLSRLLCISDVKALQLDSTNTIEERVPITIDQPVERRISRLK